MTLSEILSELKQTQEVLGERFGVHQTTAGAWLRGSSLPPSTRIPALAASLGMPVDKLKDLVARERQARARKAKRAGKVVAGRGRAHGSRRQRTAGGVQ